MFKKPSNFVAIVNVMAVSLAASLPAFADPPAKVLKGSVQEKGERERSGLSRSDMTDPNADPFSGPDDQSAEISAPDSNYKMDAPRQPNPPPQLRASASEQGRGNFRQMQPSVSPLMGEEEPMPPQQPPMRSQVQQNQDPDSSPEMQLAWDVWHHRVAEAIYTRFNFLAKLGFKHSPPLLCQVAYVVTRDGHIQNIQVQQKSPNVLFNLIVYQTVKSLDGDMALLQYPQGSRRTMVPKVGTFTQNYGGDGFKYTVGDRETLQGR